MCQKGKLSWCQIVLVPNCPIIFWFRPNSGRNLQKQQESEARPGEKFPSLPSPPLPGSKCHRSFRYWVFFTRTDVKKSDGPPFNYLQFPSPPIFRLVTNESIFERWHSGSSTRLSSFSPWRERRRTISRQSCEQRKQLEVSTKVKNDVGNRHLRLSFDICCCK